MTIEREFIVLNNIEIGKCDFFKIKGNLWDWRKMVEMLEL